MIKLPHLIFIFLLANLLISCSGDNLYEFEELTEKEDFVIQLVVIPKDLKQDFNFRTIFYQTSGYGEQINKPVTFNESGEYRIIRSAVKEYKKVGVTFIPDSNISRIEIKIYNILFGEDVFWQHFEDVDGEITVWYDFELDGEEVFSE